MVFESTVGESDLVIGQEYFGSIVKKVKQEVEDKDGKYKVKRFVTLKSGMILVEEYIRTKGQGKVENKEYGSAPGQFDDDEPPKDDSALRAKARALMAKKKEPKPDKKKKKKKKNKKPKPNLDDLYDVPAKVFPYSKLPHEQTEGAPVSGAWKHTNGTDDTDWEPMDVVITKEKPAFIDIDEPHGVVALRTGALPDEDGTVDPFDLKFFPPGEEEPSFGYYTIGHWTPGKLNQTWPPVKQEPESNHQPIKKLKLPDLDGELAKVVPESKAPATLDAGAPLTGVWKHDDGTDDTDWEPMLVDISKDPPSDLNPGDPTGIVAVEDGVEADEDGYVNPSDLKFFTPGKEPPSNFNKLGHWKPGKLNQEWPPKKPKPKPKVKKPLKLTLPDFNNVDAKIVPKSKLPTSESIRPDNSGPPLTGVWKHNDDTDDSDWDPMDVVITERPPLFLEKGEPHGLVAVEEGVKPNKVGRLDPADLSFFTPGEKPPSNYNKVGHWRPGKLNQEWPPGKPSLPDFNGPATVLPKSKAPYRLGKDDPTMGVWKHNNGTDDTEWEPMDVEITEDRPSDLEPDEPHGLVAVEEGVKPDTTGKLKPSDLNFFTPGEEPPPAFNKVGHWRPGKLNQEWPPVKRKKLPNLEGPARVLPISKAPYRQVEDKPLTGVWKHNDGTNDTNWDPMDVIISKEPVAFLERGEPHGLVAVEEDVQPNDDGTLNPSDISFFKPGEKPPPDFKKVGHWRPGKLNQDWPPVKPSLPDLDGPAKVSPRSKAPYKQLDGAPLSGVWKHNDDTNDTEWDPMDVYISKDEDSISDLEPGEPHGIVAVDKEVRPNTDGTLDPSDINLFTPGEVPPPAFIKVGHWRPGKLNQEWPPKKAEPAPKRIPRKFEKPSLPSFDGDYAKVRPKSKAHEKSIKDPPVVGVWEHNDDTDDTDWEPIGVIITNDPPSNGDFHGIVAAEEDAKPNKVGKLDPADLKFFTPGEQPPSNYTKLGHWTPAKKSEWPPSKPSDGKNIRSVGKLNLPDFDGVPESGVIYPRSQAPESHDASKEQIIAKGIWKWSKPENKPANSESWMPSKVDLCVNDYEPPDWDDKKSHGVWGVNPNVDTKVNTKPTDLWFYPPNEKTDEGFEPIGKWRPKKAEWSYPPKSVGKVEDRREFRQFERSPTTVGKLKMPSFFKGK